ncbi:MAG: cation:proton antiporter [Bacteroidetes bacterium]|nr:cation:proton antiporter [Bacteroidota bacterium]
MSRISAIADYAFYEFAIILAFAALIGGLGQLLKQPLIVMFIALGIILGPSVMDVVKSHDKIHLLAEIGIAVLLFIVGLKLDLRIIKSIGKIALITGLGQVLFTSLFGYLIGIALGFSSLHSAYIAVALTFSSTIIIVKLLSDKKEIDSLYGQIAIGFLIVQDIVVILVMIVLSAIQQGVDTSLSHNIIKTLLAGLALLAFTAVAIKWIIPRVSAFMAKSQEMLTLFSIGWAVSFASFGEMIGFSSEVGAFLAGISLASSSYKDVINSRLTTLRDFLLLFFFVHLGSNLDLNVIGNQVSPALIFSVFVLIGNPVIVLIIMGLLGYRKRTSFLAGLTVAQISEFSLIFAGMGLALGHITDAVVGLITLVGLITIGLSTYLILYSHQIYEALSPALNIFQSKKKNTEIDHNPEKGKDYHVVIIGLGRFGRRLADMLNEHPEINFLGVDFDPVVIDDLKKTGTDIIYGDLDDPDLLADIPIKKKGKIISTIPNNELSIQLDNMSKQYEFEGEIFVTATNKTAYRQLIKYGFDDNHILQPHQMAALHFYQSCIKNSVKE